MSYSFFHTDPDAPRTRSDRFAIAFMQNHFNGVEITRSQISLFITTKQKSTISPKKYCTGDGISKGFGFILNTTTGIFLRQEIAHRRDFTFVNFPASQQTEIGGPVNPDISVQTIKW